jgi:hypothetical protein
MNIILSLTTISNRLNENNGTSTTRESLKTLLEQTDVEYEVHLNIPLFIKNDPVVIPLWIKEFQEKYSHLKIFRTEDFGSITKILPTLERINNPETIIIVADDDLYYQNGLIKEHLNARSKYPNAALGFAGMSSLDGSCHFCTTLKQDTRVKILEGYKTVSYLRKFFDLNEFKENFVGKSWRDDEVLSAYMGYKNIPKIVLSYEHDTDFSPRVESFPVISHVPAETGGCHLFRHNEQEQKKSDEAIKEFYKLGYLER